MKVIVLDKKLDSGVKIQNNDEKIIGVLSLEKDMQNIRKFANRYFIYFFKVVSSGYELISEFEK